MSKVFPAAVALLCATVLQVSLAPHLAIFGVVPNFLFLVVVTLAIAEGPVAGGVSGLIGGLLFDLLRTSVVGPAALVLAVVGYTAGMLAANTFAEGWRLPVTVVAIASVTAELMYGIALVVLGLGASFWSDIPSVMIPTAVYHTVLAVLAYPWLARILRPDRPMRSFRRLA
ncbi:MAG TPA: rod shape-determining protein MreD [Coriobacteriia bacterium]